MLNLYFPDAWLEQASRNLEYAIYTRNVTTAQAGYLTGLAEVDRVGWGWIVALAHMHMGLHVSRDVPAWVYTHGKAPRG